MSVELIIIVWRIWLLGGSVLFLNSLAQVVFKPTRQNLCGLAVTIPFIAAWPLTIFSPAGRAVLFKRIENL